MFVLLVAMAATSPATTTTATPAPSATNDGDKIVCVRDNIGAEVGTHMRPKKVCMKKSDRDFMEEQAQATVKNINNRGDGRLRDIPIPR